MMLLSRKHNTMTSLSLSSMERENNEVQLEERLSFQKAQDPGREVREEERWKDWLVVRDLGVHASAGGRYVPSLH